MPRSFVVTITSIAAAQITSSGPDVLQPALREHLALLAQVAGEEDDQEDLRQLARLELEARRRAPRGARR